jgi:hypothetical protein
MEEFLDTALTTRATSDASSRTKAAASLHGCKEGSVLSEIGARVRACARTDGMVPLWALVQPTSDEAAAAAAVTQQSSEGFVRISVWNGCHGFCGPRTGTPRSNPNAES